MKELGGLIKVITIFGWLNIIAGAMSLFAIITTRGGLNLRSVSIVLLTLLGGIVYLIIAGGLSKRKKWAWYAGIAVFIYSAVNNFILGSIINIAAGLIALALLVVLFLAKKTLFETKI